MENIPQHEGWHCFSETWEVSTNLSLVLPLAEHGGGEGRHGGKYWMAMRKPLFSLIRKHGLVGGCSWNRSVLSLSVQYQSHELTRRAHGLVASPCGFTSHPWAMDLEGRVGDLLGLFLKNVSYRSVNTVFSF